MIIYLKTFYKLGIIDRKAKFNHDAYNKVISDLKNSSKKSNELSLLETELKKIDMFSNVEYVRHINQVFADEEKLLRKSKISKDSILLGNNIELGKYDFEFMNVSPLIEASKNKKTQAKFSLFNRTSLLITKEEVNGLIEQIIQEGEKQFDSLKNENKIKVDNFKENIKKFKNKFRDDFCLPIQLDDEKNIDNIAGSGFENFVKIIIHDFEKTADMINSK